MFNAENKGSVLLVVRGRCRVRGPVPGPGRDRQAFVAASHPFACVASRMERFDTNAGQGSFGKVVVSRCRDRAQARHRVCFTADPQSAAELAFELV
jgi:hypothetical protein